MLRSLDGSAAGDAGLAAPTAAAAQLAASARLARRAPTAAPPRSSGALAAASCGVRPRQRHHSRALGLPMPQAALARPPPVASRRLPGRPRAPASQPPPVSASGLPRPAAAKHPAARASVRRRLHAQLPAPGGTKGNILPNCCAIRQNMPCCIIALCPHFRGRARALCLCLPPHRRQSWPLGVVRPALSAYRGRRPPTPAPARARRVGRPPAPPPRRAGRRGARGDAPLPPWARCVAVSPPPAAIRAQKSDAAAAAAARCSPVPPVTAPSCTGCSTSASTTAVASASRRHSHESHHLGTHQGTKQYSTRAAVVQPPAYRVTGRTCHQTAIHDAVHPHRELVATLQPPELAAIRSHGEPPAA